MINLKSKDLINYMHDKPIKCIYFKDYFLEKRKHLIKQVKIKNNRCVLSYPYYDYGAIVCESNCIDYATLRFYESQYKR